MPTVRVHQRRRRKASSPTDQAELREQVDAWIANRLPHCKVLEVELFATTAEIKRRFRALALQFHPDRNPFGAERMKAINAAYRALLGKG